MDWFTTQPYLYGLKSPGVIFLNIESYVKKKKKKTTEVQTEPELINPLQLPIS